MMVKPLITGWDSTLMTISPLQHSNVLPSLIQVAPSSTSFPSTIQQSHPGNTLNKTGKYWGTSTLKVLVSCSAKMYCNVHQCDPLLLKVTFKVSVPCQEMPSKENISFNFPKDPGNRTNLMWNPCWVNKCIRVETYSLWTRLGGQLCCV